jgi:hypothetical protein
LPRISISKALVNSRMFGSKGMKSKLVLCLD